MFKSTAFWVFVLALLLVATGVSVWHLVQAKPPLQPTVEGTIQIGLPQSGIFKNTITDADSAVVWDMDTKRLLLEQNGFDRRPIASLTKLMTAMVALDMGIDWNQRATINLDEYSLGGNLLLHSGEEVTMRDLFTASLLGSANNATKAYVRMLNIPADEFVQQMNRKAIELGLEQTTFVEPTGLDPRNISTAYEVARLSEIAFSHYPDIAQATSKNEYVFTILNSNREHTIRNTNKLISEHNLVVLGSKTGYLDESKYCLTVQGSADLKNRIVVVLGSASQEQNEATILSLLQRVFP